jgi:hypothetical protein
VPVVSRERFEWLDGGYFLVSTYETVFGDAPAQTGVNYVRSVLSDRRWRRTTRAKRLAAERMDAHEWRLWERLIEERGIVIDRPNREAHPLYPDMIYPCDYGHIPGTTAADGHGIDVFVGPVQAGLVGLIALTHRPSGIADPKLLVNLTREDADAIIAFLDRGDPGPDLHLVWRQHVRRGRLPVFHRRITGVCGPNVDPEPRAVPVARSRLRSRAPATRPA